MLIEFLTNFANPIIASTCIAVITIAIVGIFKFIPGLKNMKSKQGRKAVYQLLSLVFSGGMAIAYHILVAKGAWDEALITFILGACAEVNVLYPLYENFGIRWVVHKLGSLLVPSKSKQIDETFDKVTDALTQPTSAEVAEKQKRSEETGWLE